MRSTSGHPHPRESVNGPHREPGNPPVPVPQYLTLPSRFLHTASLTGPLSLVKRAARCYGWGMAKNDLEAVLYVRVTDADRKRIAEAVSVAQAQNDRRNRREY